ncbi:MAG: iron-sulfur cluster assembly accessory protein [Cyclobacteriaceae bacterium]
MNLEPVSLTEKAIGEVKNIMLNKGIPQDYGLRIGIKGGGCGAMGYMIGFDKLNDEDLSYSNSNIPILVDKRHVMYLLGLEVDFYEGNDERGFVFNKPE